MRLQITRSTDVAVRVLRALSTGERVQASELAETVGSTAGFVRQVVMPLVGNGWVDSSPGPAGGYRARVKLSAISMLDVIEAIEGPTDTAQCVLQGGPCPGVVPCSLHDPWVHARDDMLKRLARTSLATPPRRATGTLR